MQINNKAIEYDSFGEGSPMLLVHGLGATSNFWRPVVNAFEGRFSIIAPDLPSAGRSDTSADTSIESLANDMLALLDALQIESVHLVGHSMGTIVCQHMAVLAPERIKDMVLLGPLAEPPEPARAALADRAKVARSSGMAAIADTISDVALSAKTKETRANVQGFVREMVLRQPGQAYAASCEALATAVRAEPTDIAARCLLVTGDEDAVAPPGNVQELAGELTGAEVHVLDNCGHWTLTERPTAVIELMQAFYG